MYGGRWNSVGNPLIYASMSYSCAMLEVLAHAGINRIPKYHHYLIAQVADHVSVETCSEGDLPTGWDDGSCVASKSFGDKWLKQRRSAILIVPSVVARPDFNALVNPMHPEFVSIKAEQSKPVIWDKRLFRSQGMPS